jgi:hypothetical protein
MFSPFVLQCFARTPITAQLGVLGLLYQLSNGVQNQLLLVLKFLFRNDPVFLQL